MATWRRIQQRIALVVFDEPDVAVVDGKNYRFSWLEMGNAHKVAHARCYSVCMRPCVLESRLETVVFIVSNPG